MTKTELGRLYQDSQKQRRIRLILDSKTVFTDADLSEAGVSLEESVNTGEDMNIGTACAVSLKFSLKDYNQVIPPLEGKEIRYQSGIQTNETHYEELAKQARTTVLCLNSSTLYGGFDQQPYLRAWTVREELISQTIQEQPAAPVKAIIISGNTLYCCHGCEPYLTGYSLPGLSMLPASALSPFSQQKALWYAEDSHLGGINAQGDIVKEYRVLTYDGKPVDLAETEFTFSQIGLFQMDKPEKENKTQLEVSALDRMGRFDQIVDEWVNNLPCPVAALDYLKGLCAFVGVPLKETEFINSDYRIQRNYAAENVTGRQLLQFLAQMSASFAYINPDGQLELGWYRNTDFEVTAHELWNATAAEYTAAPIDKLQIRGNENDIGVIVGSGTNALIIEDNYLLYTESDAELRPAAERIFNAVKETPYRPFEIEMIGNPFIRAGDMIQITIDEGTFPGYIMEKRGNGTRDTCTATGGRVREVQSDAIHQSIQKLRGRANELTRTVDETISKLYDTETGDINILKQTATETTSQIQDISGNLSEVQQTASSLTKRITDAEGAISETEQTVDGLVSRVQDAEGNISEVEQTASGLSSQIQDTKNRVTKVEQTASGLTTQVSGVNSHLSKVEQKIDGVTTTVQGSGGTSVTRIKPGETEYSFNGISGSGGVKISASGLRTSDSSGSGVELFGGHIILKDGGNSDMILRNGKILVMDDSGNSIGYLGKARWATTGRQGLAINMDVDTFVTFGFHDDAKGEYISPLAFNNGGINDSKGILVWDEIHSTHSIYAPAFVQSLSAAPANARTYTAPMEVQTVTSPELLTEETGTGTIEEGEKEIFLNSRIPLIGYTVFLSPIGGTVRLKEKKERSFVVEGDNVSFDYCIKYRRAEPRAMLRSAEREDLPNVVEGPKVKMRGGIPVEV